MYTLLGRQPALDATAAVAAAFDDVVPGVVEMLAVEDKPPSADNNIDEELLSDDDLALMSLSCSFCGKANSVPPESAAALAVSRTSFACAFLRAGGCVSNLRRRKR